MAPSHAHMLPACEEAIGKVSRPRTREQTHHSTSSTVGVLNYVFKMLHFKTFLATAACNISGSGVDVEACSASRECPKP